MDRGEIFQAMHQAMRDCFGSPALPSYESPFAAALAVLLRQGGKEQQAAKLMAALAQQTKQLTPLAVATLPKASFEALLQPVKKAGAVSGLLAFFAAFSDDGEMPATADLAFLRGVPVDSLREGLTAVRGIGAETADAILLHALDLPVFVTSSAIYRILRRHGMVFEDMEQQELREYFTDVLPQDPGLFREMHACFTHTARTFCKTAAPVCGGCPLKPFLEYDPVE